MDPAEDLHADLVARIRHVLEEHPGEQPRPTHGLEQRNGAEPARSAAQVEKLCHALSLPDALPGAMPIYYNTS
ncbi:Uncharacterised protein [Mycobacteroides abscessus subsp. abscessus]|nr:Uncharacterised protein [Mycobacteroides abscessus subsp. abscessus]